MEETKITIKTFTLFSLVFLMCCCAGGKDSENASTKKLESAVRPFDYCKSFSIKYAENKDSVLLEDSIKIKQKSVIYKWLSNLFQPPGSRFTAGYDCRFQIRDREELIHNVSVGLFLTETFHFAKHTQWERLQIIPIEYVADKVNETQGYGVFKYLKDTPAS